MFEFYIAYNSLQI